MKETRSLLNSLVACGIALAMVSTLAAQTSSQGSAKVVRLKGAARYAAGPNAGQLLKVGDIIKPGAVIQTAADSRVDLVLGDEEILSLAQRFQVTPENIMKYHVARDGSLDKFRRGLYERKVLKNLLAGATVTKGDQA